MKDDKVIPIFKRKDIHNKRDRANVAAKCFVSQHRQEYDSFVKKIETPKSEDESGMHDFWIAINRCMPESDKKFWLERMNKYFHDECNWEEVLYRYLQTEEGKKTFENLPDRNVLKKCSPSEATFLLVGQTKDELFSDLQEFFWFIMLTFGSFNPEYMINMMDIVLTGNDELVTFTYYYIVFDEGLQKIISQVSSIMMTVERRHDMAGYFGALVPTFVKTSAAVGITDKSAWNKYAVENDDDCIYKEVIGSLRHIKDNRGTKKDFTALTNMLVNDKEGEVLLGIENFLNENKESISLAYLLHSLERAERIKCKSFDLFRQAVNMHFDMNIPYRKAQERYSEIKNEPCCLNSKERKAMIKAKQIIEEWTEVFRNCA